MTFKKEATEGKNRSMDDFTPGSVLEGTVKSITKFGAFVSLPGGKTGMVHISEIAHAYVSDIHEHLTEGQTVKVMIIAVDPAGKINLSIKRTLPQPKPAGGGQRPAQRGQSRARGDAARSAGPKEPQSFDDMVKQFMQDSDSKISSLRQYTDHRSRNRRR